MRARLAIALAAALLGTVSAFTARSAVAQSAAPAAHQYVVGVAGMH